MEYPTLLIEVADRIATITINRPELSNAFASSTYGEIGAAVTELGARNDVGAIVITGKGKHFSAGGDIKRFKELIDSKTYLLQESIEDVGIKMIGGLRNCPKPVIAMINGMATGAGLSCALACDFRVVDANSKMAMGFVNLGLSGDNGSIYNLVQLIGVEKASMMMMTGDPVKGAACIDMGLASVFAEEGKLEETTYALAKKLASKSDAAHAAQKRLISKYFYGVMDEYLKEEAAEIASCSRKPDFSEAINAFLEKRMPEFNK